VRDPGLFVLHRVARAFPWFFTILLLCCTFSCGGADICHCRPTATTSQDFRHAEKHVPLPDTTPVETTVSQILGWPLGPDPTNTTPRTGRELTLYHIATAYLQNARLISFDCDVHLEISDVRDKTAPRVIVETPIDEEYCDNRKSLEERFCDIVSGSGTSATRMSASPNCRKLYRFRCWG